MPVSWWQTPEGRAACAAHGRRVWADPAFRAMMRERSTAANHARRTWPGWFIDVGESFTHRCGSDAKSRRRAFNYLGGYIGRVRRVFPNRRFTMATCDGGVMVLRLNDGECRKGSHRRWRGWFLAIGESYVEALNGRLAKEVQTNISRKAKRVRIYYPERRFKTRTTTRGVRVTRVQ